MPRFEPFAALRYESDRAPLSEVSAPPYDVIADDERAELVARHPFNAVRIDLPVDENGEDRYDVAERLFREWQEQGVLVRDEAPTFTIYRMAFVDESGTRRHTTGVIGALELSPPGTGDILPHEHTTPKAKSDRLDLLRATRANLSAIWGLSLAKGLTDLLPTDGEPDAQWTAADGVEHTVWVVRDAERIATLAAAVADQPIVIADGHHRYETSLAYRDERRARQPDDGGADLTLALVVELVDDELTVQPIHRLLDGLPDDLDLRAALAPVFDSEPTPAIDDRTPARLIERGALCLVEPHGATYLIPKPEALEGVRDLDSSRLDAGLAHLPDHELRYQHGVANVVDAVRLGRARAGVLLRPASIAQIEATAHGGDRMPPKTTFFSPKPATGVVFREL